MIAKRTYTDRELDQKFQQFDERAVERHGIITTALGNLQDDIKEVKAQTQKTNGRVTEQEIESRVMRARINTIVIIIGFFIASILIPLVAAFIQSGKL